jgi:geranylgeranyl pyrophosphate synthase
MAELLGVENVTAVGDLLDNSLLKPVTGLVSQPGKGIRGQLVGLGYRLLSQSPPSLIATKQCRSCAEVVELIHAGSLIIDDIEDGSRMRRGHPALHVQYGMPVALNAGNWLYFFPFQLLRQTQLANDKLLYLYEHCHETLLRAHFGQAIDLGADIGAMTQARVSAACFASIRLKTGALMAFALMMGGVIADVPEKSLSILDDFGVELGMALQMFDDLGNLTGKREPSKKHEDLVLSRPSWIWAYAADSTTVEEYRCFVAAVRRLPDDRALEMWIEEHDLVQRARTRAREYLDSAFQKLELRLGAERVRWSSRALGELRELGQEIATAYE